MAIMDEVEALSRERAQDNELPEVVYLGINKHRQLISEMIPKMRYSNNLLSTPGNVSYIYTSIGQLHVEVVDWNPDIILVGENTIIKVLIKLGLKW